jgi:hypothetical protein
MSRDCSVGQRENRMTSPDWRNASQSCLVALLERVESLVGQPDSEGMSTADCLKAIPIVGQVVVAGGSMGGGDGDEG